MLQHVCKLLKRSMFYGGAMFYIVSHRSIIKHNDIKTKYLMLHNVITNDIIRDRS